jgi:hypothetical protein
MPRLMSVIFPMEFIFSPRTYILFRTTCRASSYRRPLWPDNPEPTFAGLRSAMDDRTATTLRRA